MMNRDGEELALLRQIVKELAEIRIGVTVIASLAAIAAVILLFRSLGVEPLFGSGL